MNDEGRWEIFPNPRLDLSKENKDRLFVCIADTYDKGVTSISVCVIRKTENSLIDNEVVETCNYLGRPNRIDFYYEIEKLLAYYTNCNTIIEDKELMNKYKLRGQELIDCNSEEVINFREQITTSEFKRKMKEEFEFIMSGKKRPFKLIT